MDCIVVIGQTTSYAIKPSVKPLEMIATDLNSKKKNTTAETTAFTVISDQLEANFYSRTTHECWFNQFICTAFHQCIDKRYF